MISLEDADFLKSFLKGPSAAPVSLVLNWTNILPTQKQVGGHVGLLRFVSQDLGYWNAEKLC